MTTFFCLTFTGVPFTSLSLVGIFILLGVGVDDVLVLLESFRMARITIPNGGTVETRVRFATERAGVSITITSATSVIAFSLGSMTVSSFLFSYGQLTDEVVLTLLKVIPAVNWFCAYMACAITFDYIMCMTLFMAIIVAHERRDQARGVPAVAYERAAAETSPLPGLELDTIEGTIETTGSNNSGSTVAKLVGPEKGSTQTRGSRDPGGFNADPEEGFNGDPEEGFNGDPGRVQRRLRRVG